MKPEYVNLTLSFKPPSQIQPCILVCLQRKATCRINKHTTFYLSLIKTVNNIKLNFLQRCLLYVTGFQWELLRIF